MIAYIATQTHGRNIVIISNERDHAQDVFDELIETMNLRTEEEIQETIYFDLREQLGTDEEGLEIFQLKKGNCHSFFIMCFVNYLLSVLIYKINFLY
jgi:hypothetical protein